MTGAELDAWLEEAASSIGVPRFNPDETRALLDLVGRGTEPDVVRSAIVGRVPGNAS